MSLLDIFLIFILFIAVVVIIYIRRSRYNPYKGGAKDTEPNATTIPNIIHVGGPEASGKTTLAEKLKTHYAGDPTIGIYDLDDLYAEYEQTNQLNVQTYLNFILGKAKQHTKTIYVGIPVHLGRGSASKFVIPGEKKYAIELDVDVNVKRLFLREINSWSKWFSDRDKDILYSNLLEDEFVVKSNLNYSMNRALSISTMKNDIIFWRDFFKDNNYTFMPVEDIFTNII